MAWCETERRSISCSAWPSNAGWSSEIAAELDAAGSTARRDRQAGAAFQGVPGRRWTAGAARAASSPRPSGPAGRGQPALRRHLAGPRRARGPPPLREGLLRPRRDGEPHQGVPARPVRRPHLGQDDARQPVAAVVRRDGLCAGLRLAPHRPRSTPSSPRPPAARSASSCSRSARSSGSASAASRSRWPRPAPTRPSIAPPMPHCRRGGELTNQTAPPPYRPDTSRQQCPFEELAKVETNRFNPQPTLSPPARPARSCPPHENHPRCENSGLGQDRQRSAGQHRLADPGQKTPQSSVGRAPALGKSPDG